MKWVISALALLLFMHAACAQRLARLTTCRFMWRQTATMTATIAWRQIGRVEQRNTLMSAPCAIGTLLDFSPTSG
jgi:hypothetical protein